MSKILVAEDNLPNRELIREILETCGYEVIEAGDGQQALDKLEESVPDLVLLDIQMPVCDKLHGLPDLRYWRLRLTPCRETEKKFWKPALMAT